MPTFYNILSDKSMDWSALFEKKKALSFRPGRTRQAFGHRYDLEVLKWMESPWELLQR